MANMANKQALKVLWDIALAIAMLLTTILLYVGTLRNDLRTKSEIKKFSIFLLIGNYKFLKVVSQ